MAIGDELTADGWFAQRKLKQTGDPTHAAPARARHAVKCVCHASHSGMECRASVFIPGVAVSTADADLMHVESFYCLECPWYFGCDGYTLQYVCVLEQLPHNSGRGILNELGALGSGFDF